ncbi:hypothetical protein N0V82_010588 [Gnomoniopsis sp. IMI 355080]|nr:hypothetical protein N0V82_010588 [Gnomoniopsis sp. IMI 355080]
MRFLTFALLVPATLGASLALHGRDNHCAPLYTNNVTVNTLVNDYAQLIGNYTPALGQRFLSNSSFTDTSDSINALANLPLGSTTFPSKAAFLANQATQPKVPLVVKSINAVTCDTVVLRWTQTFGEASLPIAGISILGFVCEGGQWKLQTLYTEFNSLVYIEDAGGSCTAPSS